MPHGVEGCSKEVGVKNTDNLNSKLEELEKISQSLKAALISRDPDAILAAVGEQEELIQGLCTDEELYRMNGSVTQGAENVQDGGQADSSGSPQADNAAYRDKVAGIAGKIRRIQVTNSRLARSFLDAINRTFAFLGSKQKSEAGTYSSNGDIDSENRPVLVQQTG